jgi:hypothetical protein
MCAWRNQNFEVINFFLYLKEVKIKIGNRPNLASSTQAPLYLFIFTFITQIQVQVLLSWIFGV